MSTGERSETGEGEDDDVVAAESAVDATVVALEEPEAVATGAAPAAAESVCVPTVSGVERPVVELPRVVPPLALALPPPPVLLPSRSEMELLLLTLQREPCCGGTGAVGGRPTAPAVAAPPEKDDRCGLAAAGAPLGRAVMDGECGRPEDAALANASAVLPGVSPRASVSRGLAPLPVPTPAPAPAPAPAPLAAPPLVTPTCPPAAEPAAEGLPELVGCAAGSDDPLCESRKAGPVRVGVPAPAAEPGDAIPGEEAPAAEETTLVVGPGEPFPECDPGIWVRPACVPVTRDSP